MSRVIIGTKVFEKADLQLFYEREVQRQVAARAHTIFPGYNYVPFTALVESPHGRHRPDFALVEREYRAWYVCELELIHHDLYDHVLPQVETFRDGRYDDYHVSALHAGNSTLDRERLRLLVEGMQPTVYVIANRSDATWQSTIRYHRGILGVFEIYRVRDTAEFLFRVNGDSPLQFTTLLTTCQHDRTFPRLMDLRYPSALLEGNGEEVTIAYEGELAVWKVFREDSAAYLSPVGGNILDPAFVYELHRSDAGLMLKKGPKKP